MSILKAIHRLRKAQEEEKLAVFGKNTYSIQQIDSERQRGWGEILTWSAERMDKAPFILGAVFGAGSLSGAVEVQSEVGFAMAGAMVVAKGLASLAKSHHFVKAYKSRNFLEEEVALFLNDDPNDYMNKKNKTLSTSMEMLIGYNRAYSNAKRYDSFEKFIKFGKNVVTKAMAFVEDEFMSKIETEDERTWVDRFIKKPLNKLVPKPIKDYLENASQKRRLINWVESRHDQFESSDYKKLLDKEETEFFASHKKFEEDLERVFEESYADVLSSSIKTNFVDMVDDYFTMCHRFRDQDRLKEQFDNNLRDKFERIANLYKETKNEKYYVISKLAESTIRNVDTSVIKHIKGWNNSNEDSTNKKIITDFIDKVAFMKDKPRMLNIQKENNPIITIFNKKLDAIMDSRSSKNLTIGESEERIENAGFEPVVWTNNDRLQIKESTEKANRMRYLQNHYVSEDLKKARAAERREIQKEINEFDKKQNNQSGEEGATQERRRRKIS